MDLETVADELYALPPVAFTTARDQHAQDSRDAGEQHRAGQIRRLRHPTLAAWASNLLVRPGDKDVARLLRRGRALYQAHKELDGHRLREPLAQQREVVASLVRPARRAGGAGR